MQSSVDTTLTYTTSYSGNALLHFKVLAHLKPESSRALFHTGRPQPITCPLSHRATTTNHVPSSTPGDHNQSRPLFHTGRPQPITCPLSHRAITTNHGNTNLLSWLNCNPVTMQTLRLYFSFTVSTKVAWLAVLAALFLMTLLLVSMAIYSH